MGISIWQILVIVLVILLFFGRGRISGVMEDLGKGIKSFKKGIADEPETPPARLEKKDDVSNNG